MPTITVVLLYMISGMVEVINMNTDFVGKLIFMWKGVNRMKAGKFEIRSVALAYGLDDWGSRVRFPAGAGNSSLHHRIQNGSGAHPASFPMGSRGSLPGGKVAGA
jgi:hypothetical protein